MSSPVAPSRFSTRDLLGPTLIFIAAFLLAVSVAAPTFLVAKFRKVSLDTDFTVVATSAPGAKFLDACALDDAVAVVREQGLMTGQRVVAVRPADAATVTLQAGTSVRIADDKTLGRCGNATVSAFKDRVSLDRNTAAPRATPVSEVQFDSNRAPVPLPDRTGVTYVFPRDPRPGLMFYDVATGRSVPLTAAGDANVNGLDALRFRAVIPDTDLSTRHGIDGRPEPGTLITRPARWFGPIAGVAPSTPLIAALHRSGSWSLSVDPATGVIVNAEFTVRQEYRIAVPGDNPALARLRLTSIDATFHYDRDTQQELVDDARAQSRPQVVWGRVVPLVAGVLGLVALVAGVVLLIRRRPEPEGEPVENGRGGGTAGGDDQESRDGVRGGQNRDGLDDDDSPRDQ